MSTSGEVGPASQYLDREHAMSNQDWDVVVIGAGNAAGCAALAAREHGATVAMLECAPEDEAGGNTRFTAGAMRVVYDGVEDIQKLVPDLSETELSLIHI